MMSFITWAFLRARMVSASWSGLSSTRRMLVLCISTPIEIFAISVQREVKSRAFPYHAFRPHLPPVALDDALHRGQANSGSLKLLLGMQALEGCEQLVDVSHVEADAVVAHVVGSFAVLLRAAELNQRLRIAGAEFPRVLQQVLQRYSQQAAVAMPLQSAGHMEPYPPFRISLLDHGCRGERQNAKIHGFAPQVAAHDARELQESINQLAHVLAGVADTAQRVLTLRIHFVAVVLQQYLAEAVNAAQGGAQVVRHRVAEGLQFGHAVFQFQRAPAQALFQAFALGNVA